MSKFYTILFLILGFNLKLNSSENKENKEITSLLNQYLITDISNLVMDYVLPKKFNVNSEEVFKEFKSSLSPIIKLLLRTPDMPKTLYLSELLINKNEQIVVKLKTKHFISEKYFFFNLNGQKIESNKYTKQTPQDKWLHEGLRVPIPKSKKSVKLLQDSHEVLITDNDTGKIIDRLEYEYASLYNDILVVGDATGNITIHIIS